MLRRLLEPAKRHQVHTTTTVNRISATTKANGVKLRLSGNVEEEFQPNQNTLCACRWSKGYTRIILRTAWNIKSEVSEKIEGDVELTKRYHAHFITIDTITMITTFSEAKGVKVKLLGHIQDRHASRNFFSGGHTF